MRKKAICLIFALVLLCCVCVISAAAADDAGFYDVGTAEGVSIVPSSDNMKLDVTLTSPDPSAQYLVYLVEGTGLPTKSDQIFYIDQKSGSTVSFTVYPKDITKDMTMTLYITSDNDAEKKISMKYKAAYMPGDLNDDGAVNAKDVLLIRKYIKDSDANPLTAAQIVRADINHDGYVNAKDLLKIRQNIKDKDKYPLT